MAGIKIPPHSQEAEESILGAILLDKNAVIAVAEFLRPEHFYSESHRLIYEAMLALYEERKPIDVVTLTEKLKKVKNLKKAGGRAYLTELVEKVPSAANIEAYGKIVKDDYVKRELISASSEIIEDAFGDDSEADDVLDKAEQSVFSLSQRHVRRAFIDIKQALADSFDRLDELHKTAGGLRGVPSGFKSLDNTLAGFQQSNLIIVAARPGMGKTSLILNMAQFIAVQAKVPVGFFSLEMSREELVDRLLVGQADVDAWKLKTGRLDENDFARLSEAMGVLAESPVYIDDTPALTVLEMRTKARRLVAEHGAKIFFVDYLQLARSSRKFDNRAQEVSEISQGLKNLARELKVPVIACSQLNRAVEQRGTKKPQLADLRESGAIEQDADVVMFLWRPDEEEMENMNLSVSKHRNGALRDIPLYWKGDRVRFYDMETKRADKE